MSSNRLCSMPERSVRAVVSEQVNALSNRDHSNTGCVTLRLHSMLNGWSARHLGTTFTGLHSSPNLDRRSVTWTDPVFQPSQTFVLRARSSGCVNSVVRILASSNAFPALTATNSPIAICTAFSSHMLMSTCFACSIVVKDAAAKSSRVSR